MEPSTTRVHKGDIVKVLWNDACEGPVEQNIAERGKSFLRGSTTVTISSIGRYFRVANGYLILDDVVHEESDGSILYEKQAQGKWLSIPLGVILQVTPIGEIADMISRETKGRRMIFRQLRFIPRTKRLASGEVSRLLYVA